MAIHNIVIHTAAQLEFRESYDWYEAKQAGLGKQFAAAVRVRLTDIVANPHRGTKTKRGYRETLVDDTFPFLLVFLLSKNAKELFISAIYHTSRNPRGKYRKRA